MRLETYKTQWAREGTKLMVKNGAQCAQYVIGIKNSLEAILACHPAPSTE